MKGLLLLLLVGTAFASWEPHDVFEEVRQKWNSLGIKYLLNKKININKIHKNI
jgi:hypothetical protein